MVLIPLSRKVIMEAAITNNYQRFRLYNKEFLKYDLVSGLVVFLVAIPLCLGIAIASGAPLLSGIISGILGGLVVGLLSGSQVSVSGPAAGMATIVVTTIAELGGFNGFLAALIVAGGIQILIGSLKAGFIADYVPSNVVQGLLCAIGLLLIIKQLPLAFTLSSNIHELQTHLLETTEGFTFLPFQELMNHVNNGAIIISLISFFVLYYFDKTRQMILKEIPGPIVVVILGILINEGFVLYDSPLAQNSPQLVNIPKLMGFEHLLQQVTVHDLSAWQNPKVYFYGFIIAIIASLETLLNVKAAEKLDKKRRYYSKDHELMAQGVGNLLAGFIGGLPITSVIVRTSVNIQAGAKTKLATILHGLFILLAIRYLPEVLNKIPLCSLAAILIYTGYKLTKPEIYRKIYKQGMDRFIPFIVTLIIIIAFNLLAGILLGLMMSLFFILRSNSLARLDLVKEYYPGGVINRLILPQQISFLNKASLVAELETIPNNSQLIIDARSSSYIDKEILDLIQEFHEEKAPLKSISLNLIGFKKKYAVHNYMDFINVTTYDVQAALLPPQVLHILREGNQRFVHDVRIHRATKMDIQHTAKMQHPIAVVLGCIDSRVPVETIFDMTFGDLFITRIAGNVINNDILAGIEYACDVVGAKLIVVLGHTRCGAIAAACDGVEKGHITELLAKIQPAIAAEKNIIDDRTSHNHQFTKYVTELNVANTLQQIYEQSKILRNMIDNDEIGIVGSVYDVSSGKVHFRDFSPVIKLLKGDQMNQRLSEHLSKLIKQETKYSAAQSAEATSEAK